MSTPQSKPKIETVEYAKFVRRIMRAYSRRVGGGDVDALAEMVAAANEFDLAVKQAVTELRADHGFSWADIALRLGMTRQGAQQRWGR